MVDFAVVGPGRAGLSFSGALTEAGWTRRAMSGRSDDLRSLAADVDVVLLTVPDDAVSEVARTIEPGRAVVIHVSGATGLDALATHPNRGSVHPLMSLPDADTGAERLSSGVVFAVAGHGRGLDVAQDLVRALDGRAVPVSDGDRGLYHATAAIAANHLVALCAQVERLARRVGVPDDAYWALMATTLDNVRRAGALSSLTGPAARGDTSTLALHLGALPPSERDLYVTLAAEASRLAGRTTPAVLRAREEAARHDEEPWVTRPASTTEVPEIISEIAELRRTLDDHRRAGRTVGFVPTMGYLHDGHGSLMRAAGGDDVVVASIFVNPLQFAAGEDLGSYPRDLDRDTTVAAGNGVDILFTPTVEEMYPHGPVLTSVSVAELSDSWDGESRPTHFAGVATVVSKLLNIVGPCRAYFGEKDYQQLAIIKRMVADLSAPVDVVGCPVVREPDGLAMSSRNVYLSTEDRAAALVLRRALDEGAAVIAAGERDPATVDSRMKAVVDDEPRAELDYAAAVDPESLTQPTRIGAETRLLIAASFGTTRLIDNCGVTTGPAKPTGEP